MQLLSIRWRLSLSYAAIACLAALVLGAALLVILRGYYGQKERQYLASNAAGVEALVAGAITQDMPLEALTPQLKNLAFVSKTRIRVLDPNNTVVADSVIPDEPYVITLVYKTSNPGVDGEEMPGADMFLQSALPIEEQPLSGDGSADPVPSADIVLRPAFEAQGPPAIYTFDNTIIADVSSTLPVASTFYGFQLGGGVDQWSDFTERDDTLRSNQTVRRTMVGADGNLLGTIVVSDGPAYGSAIVRSVAHGWALASAVAVVLAAGAGWFISRQITKPLLTLTDVTARMTAGDLAARAKVDRRDELGLLATSYNRMAERIQETVVTLQRFVADAAHELHTPLTALRTNLELAQNGTNPEAIRRACGQAVRLQMLTDDLLDLSRIEARADDVLTEPLNLAALLRATSEVYASRAEQADLLFALEIASELPPVMGNGAQLARVVANLLDNAIKFTPPGGMIRVAMGQTNGHVSLSVTDTGIGIPAEDLPTLFERFHRGRNAAGYPGSGLGLALTRAVVQAHNGKVQAVSDGTGTTLTIMLPAAGSHTP